MHQLRVRHALHHHVPIYFKNVNFDGASANKIFYSIKTMGPIRLQQITEMSWTPIWHNIVNKQIDGSQHGTSFSGYLDFHTGLLSTMCNIKNIVKVILHWKSVL